MAEPKPIVFDTGKFYPEYCGDVISGRDVRLKSGGVAYWERGDKAIRMRDVPITAIVLHHTAGEGDGSRIYQTLRNRKSAKAPAGLSIHFTIDRSGRIIQHCDAFDVAFHAIYANDFSIGIEIANQGVPVPTRKSTRKRYRATLHGRTREFLAFDSAQVDSAYRLCKALCDIASVPFDFPRSEDGSVLYKAMSEKEVRAHRGLLAHFHITKTKIDPSPHLIHDLLKRKAGDE